MNKKSKNPIRWVPSVYFAMGLPFVALSLVSVLIFKDLGVPNEDIAFWTSWLILPWSLKPFLSLIMETFGTKKIYVVLTEMLSAVMFGAIAFALPLSDFFSITLVLMGIIAFSGSMHDIAGDGIYMAELDTATQSKYSGWQGAFYNLAKVLTNGGMAFLAGWLVRSMKMDSAHAWQVIMALCGIIMLGISLYHILVLPKDSKPQVPFKERLKELLLIISTFFKKRHILYYFVFIVLYRFAEGLAMKIAPLFLKDSVEQGGIGLDNEEYGLIYGTFGAIAFIIGSILAGYYVAHRGLKRALFTLACFFNIPFAVYLIFAIYQPQELWIISIGIVLEYFGYGFGFVGLILFMMQQIAPGKYQMAHYAFANSLMNLGVMIPGMVSGYLSTSKTQISILEKLHLNNYMETLTPLFGYKLFFIIVMIATIPALLITYFVPFTYSNSEISETSKE